MKISTKVSATLLLVLMTAMAVSGWFSISEQRKVLGGLLRDRGQSLAHAIAVFCIETLLSEDYPILDTFLETTGREREDILSIEVSHQGTLVSSYHSGGEEYGDRIVFQSDILFATEPDRQPIKLGEVRLGLSDQANKMIIASRIRESVTHTVVIFVLLSGALLVAMRKVVLQKIHLLDRHARRIDNSHLDLKIDLQTDDELGKLAQTLNDTVAKLKGSQEELQLYQEHLELLVKERTRELEEAQEELVNKATEAGRAQLAAMVLHNIGNAMTPFNVQIEAMRAGQSKAIVGYLEKCYQALKANLADLTGFVNADPRGTEVFRYMGELVAALKVQRNRDGDALQKMDRAMAYVSEILTMQQAYAAGEQEIKQSVYLNALIDDAVSIQMGSLERKGIVVEQRPDAAVPRLLIDKNRLMQVIINLIKNSSEAFERLAPDDRTKTIRIKTFADKRHIGFEITDNGSGIDPEQIEHIFDFGKSYRRSSGFGLYFCKMFVEDNGGMLNVSSSENGPGTTVRAVFKKTGLSTGLQIKC